MPPKMEESPSSVDLSRLEERGAFINQSPVVCATDARTRLGDMIRALRREKGMSQEELARKAQIDRTTIARLECGIIKSLSMERL